MKFYESDEGDDDECDPFPPPGLVACIAMPTSYDMATVLKGGILTFYNPVLFVFIGLLALRVCMILWVNMYTHFMVRSSIRT